MHLTRRLNLWRSWTMVGSGGVTRDVHCQVVYAGNPTRVSKSVHAVTIKVNAVTSL
jgi:acetyltransferase-like isoleucine patch superfamily enzyme